MIDFSVTDEQRQFVEMIRRFGKEVIQPAELALDKLGDADGVFRDERFWSVMDQAFELGLHKMGIREEFGGLGLDPCTAGMVWEELARWGLGFAAGLMAGSVVPQMISVLASDKKDLVEKYVRPYCEQNDPKLISAWGSSEPNVGSDGKNYYDTTVRHHTTAVLKDSKWVINGTKSNFVSNASIANSYVIFACVDPAMGLRGSGAFVVPADAPGVVKSKALDKIGMRALNQAPIFFDDVEIPEDHLIFPPGEGYPILHHTIITVGNLGTGYLAVGLLRAAYEEALAYAQERVQWGKPIAQHQLVTKKLFDAYTAIETARTFLYKGSWLSKTGFPGDLKTSITGKVYATNEASRHTAEMVQVLGGYGIAKDYNLEKYMRDAPLLQIMDGTNDTLMMEAMGQL